MILGKWNKSVILTYVGLLFSIVGMYFFIVPKAISCGIVCMMYAGVCDLFDGTVARRCKRTKEEKQFGIELDSLIDVVSFIAFPITYFLTVFHDWYYIPFLGIYAIYGIARLAHFNTIQENDNKPVPFYHGLPVTYAALIFPIFYLLSFVVSPFIYSIALIVMIVVTSILYIVDIHFPKPKLMISIGLFILAIILTIVYLFVL